MSKGGLGETRVFWMSTMQGQGWGRGCPLAQPAVLGTALPPSLAQPSLGSFDSVSDVDTPSPAKWDVFMTPLTEKRNRWEGSQDCSFLLFWALRPSPSPAPTMGSVGDNPPLPHEKHEHVLSAPE